MQTASFVSKLLTGREVATFMGHVLQFIHFFPAWGCCRLTRQATRLGELFVIPALMIHLFLSEIARVILQCMFV